MVKTNISSAAHCQALIHCLNHLIQVLNTYGIVRSVVILNLEVDVSYPMTRYDVAGEIPPLLTDLRPDLYISNLGLLEFEELLDKITTSYSFNSRATYMFISPNWTNMEDEMYSRHISRVIFVNSSVCGKFGNILDTTGPVLPDESKCDIEEEKLISGLSKDVKRKPLGTTNLKLCFGAIWFPRVICANCTRNRGLVIDVFDMFGGFIGQSPSYIICGVNFHYRNLLLMEVCDVCLHGLLPENSLVDFILPLRNDFDYWYVPRSPQISTWKYMMVALPMNIWIVCIAVLVSLSFLKWAMTKISANLGESQQHPLNILEIVSKYFLEQQGNADVTLCSSMFFFYGVLLSVFFLNVIYKTRFTYLLQGEHYYSQDIRTVQDAAAKGLRVTYSKHLRNDLETAYPEIREYFTSHFVPSDEQNWVSMVAFRKDTVALKTSLSAKFLKKFYLDRHGKSLIDVLDEPARPSIGAFIFLKGHPVMSKMPRFINRLRDHGFLSLILSKYDLKDRESGIDVRHRKLRFNQIKGPFLVLFVGNSIACIILILELLNSLSHYVPSTW